MTEPFSPCEPVAWLGGALDGRVQVAGVVCRTIEEALPALAALPGLEPPSWQVAAGYLAALQVFAASRAESGETVIRQLASRLPAACGPALERMRGCAVAHQGTVMGAELAARLLMEARRLHRELAERSSRLAVALAENLPERGACWLHGAGGPLAWCGPGPLVGALALARAGGRELSARIPRRWAQSGLQECSAAGLPADVVDDLDLGAGLQRGGIQALLLVARRCAANGDCQVESGGFAAATAARWTRVPVIAVVATVEAGTATGRAWDQVGCDTVPCDLLGGLALPAGLVRPPYRDVLARSDKA